MQQRIPEKQRKGALARLAGLGRSEVLQPYFTQRLTAGGAALDVSIISTALIDDAGQVYAIATTERAKPTAGSGNPLPFAP